MRLKKQPDHIRAIRRSSYLVDHLKMYLYSSFFKVDSEVDSLVDSEVDFLVDFVVDCLIDFAIDFIIDKQIKFYQQV